MDGGRRFEEEWSKPNCDCGFQCVLRTTWTLNNSTRRFYGCPRYKRNEVDGCGFIRWVDPPSFPVHGERFKEEIRGFLKRLEEMEDNVKQLQIMAEKREEELGSILKMLRDLKSGVCFCVGIFSCVLYILVMLFIS
ncbi:uncharacterized protein LOC133784366 [Humulus lupulus]|uniref:uncharacterized protein LOC133784366 n=1 Tax=Humulus lupulus TaxID=3486 RepID=UPI002B414529|nr:uncharacterized protein LOC133784366 [Humulus lupulus]